MVGMELGIAAVDGSDAVVLVPVPEVVDNGAAVAVGVVDVELAVATISHVWEGVYASSVLELV
jgi:hypothetical protein